ncbi:twin-arginine translocation signal domain-containing protein [Actinacidiphila soli]|uniref:twin-arginine translocation signal domain-containing protein n=1 Tax=Actinacidiphila soli TaxID=2487275 RepID=UPI001F0C520D|nr:twin-arginine translocation signal domain-containing protein [Actinacidiphila soli]
MVADISRRNMLKIAGAAAGAVTIGAGLTAGTASAAGATFAHPGMLHTQADFDRMAAKVKAGTGLWKAGYDTALVGGLLLLRRRGQTRRNTQ